MALQALAYMLDALSHLWVTSEWQRVCFRQTNQEVHLVQLLKSLFNPQA